MISAALCSPAAIIGGKLFDMYQSYTPAFILNMVVAAIGIAALAFARMPVAPSDKVVAEPEASRI